MNELSIAGTVSFQEECKDRWQTVYTSSLYGTMFSLIGRFDYNKDSKSVITGELRLVNYKGPINLGIKSVKFQKHRQWVRVYEEDGLDPKVIRTMSLNVELQGLNTKQYESFSINCNFTKEDLANPIYLEIDRRLVSLSDVKDNYKNGVFDSEFFYRDGLRSPHIFKGEFQDYITGEKLNPTVNKLNKLIDNQGRFIDEFGRFVDESGNLLNEELNRESTNNVIDRSPGAVCPKGYSKIIF